MLRIRSKEDLFLNDVSPWRSRNRDRSRKRHFGTWQEHNQSRFRSRGDGSICNPYILDDIEEFGAIGVKTEDCNSSHRDFADGISGNRELPNQSSFINSSSAEVQQDEHRRVNDLNDRCFSRRTNGAASISFSPQEARQVVKMRDDEDLGFFTIASLLNKNERAVGKAYYQSTSPYIRGSKISKEGNEISVGKKGGLRSPPTGFNDSVRIQYPVPQGDHGNKTIQSPTISSSSQTSSTDIYPLPKKSQPLSITRTSPQLFPRALLMPGQAKYPCIFRASRPGELYSAASMSNRPLVRARKRAAAEAGLTLEEYAANGHQETQINTDGGKDTPPMAKKSTKKRKKSQSTTTRRKRAKKSAAPKVKDHAIGSTISDQDQKNVVEIDNAGVEKHSITPDNNHNLASECDTSPLSEVSSIVSVLSNAPSVMSRQPSVQPSPAPELTEDEVNSQSAAPAPAAQPPELTSNETVGASNLEDQNKFRHGSPERPTTISEVTDDEIEERKFFVPDRASAQELNRLFFTPRPERLLTREEMSRFLDPDLLPRFNPALKKSSEFSKPAGN